MSVKFNYIYPIILESYLTEMKGGYNNLSNLSYERFEFKNIRKLFCEKLLSFKDDAKNKSKILRAGNVYFDKNNNDFDNFETEVFDIEKAKDVEVEKNKIEVRYENIDLLRDVGLSLYDFDNIVENTLLLSFYGRKYELTKNVSQDDYSLVLTIKSGKVCNNVNDADQITDYLQNEDLEEYNKIKAQIQGEKPQQCNEKIENEEITLIVKEPSVEDAFKIKNMFGSVITSNNLFENKTLKDFCNNNITFNGNPLKLDDVIFLKFLEGRLVLIYEILWNILRFAYCYNKKKNQFLTTIM